MKMTKLVSALCAAVLAIPAWAQTEAAPTAQAVPEASEVVHDKVLVVGQRPGPGLWKISKGDNVLWVFATHAPLPARMEWRSQEVEAILARSQEFLYPPSVTASVGVWQGLTLLPHAIGMMNNPDGATLREVVPADVYARWRLLKAKYGVKDDVERQRPLFAAEALYRAGLRHAGLSNSNEVMKTLDQLIKKYKVKTMHSHVTLDTSNASAALKQFKKSPMDDVACFDKTLRRLETEIDTMRLRANAWAKGDVAAIRALGYSDRDAACFSAMTSNAAIREQIAAQDPERRMRRLWLEAAEKALATNHTSFAALSLKKILDGDDLVAALKEKGYTVEAPE